MNPTKAQNELSKTKKDNQLEKQVIKLQNQLNKLEEKVEFIRTNYLRFDNGE